MYSSGYSQVNKYSPEAQRRMRRSKGKSCGYYMRIVFFFSSLIQSLIIVSLVLFLIYGKKEDTAATAHVQDLESTFSQLSVENVALKLQRKNLTNLLNVTLTNKARNDWDLDKCRKLVNVSTIIIQELDKRAQYCLSELNYCKVAPQCPNDCPRTMSNCNCGMLFEQVKAKNQLVETNFTQTMLRMKLEMEQIAKERDSVTLEAIKLRRDKSILEKELQMYRNKIKDDFSEVVSGISSVSKGFLEKINSLTKVHETFQLTCAKQGNHLEQIRTNCTNLSKEVEDKLQIYLNTVGDKVSKIQSDNNHLKAENDRLHEDYRWCSNNRSGLIQEHKQNLAKLQEKHDREKENLLLDKMKLHGNIEVLENSIIYKNKEADYRNEQLRQLNISCSSRTGSGVSTSRGNVPPQSVWNMANSGGSSSASSSSSGIGGQPRTGLYNLGSSVGSSAFNKPLSTGTGSSSSSFLPSGSSPSHSSLGSVFNKPVSSGVGSSGSSSGLGSTGLGQNKPGSAAGSFPSSGSAASSSSSSSSGTSLNKPAVATRGSSTTGGSSGSSSGSSYGSVGPSQNVNSGGISPNKPTTNIKSPTSFGSFFGSSGTASKTGSTSSGVSSWLGLGNSNSGQSRTGSGTGSSSGTGRTNGVSGGSSFVNQHLKELNSFINPPRPEDKQDLSRLLG